MIHRFLDRLKKISQWGALSLGIIGTTFPSWAFNQNPVPGSLWTYLGPSFGADWVSPQTSTATCNSILNFGGDRSGTNNNDAALNDAVGAFAANPCVYFPAGTYKFAGQYVYNLGSNRRQFILEGDGAGTSILYWPGGGGIRVNGGAAKTGVQFRNLSFQTGATNVGTAVDLDWGSVHNSGMPSSSFQNIEISGQTLGTDYWNKEIRINGLSQVNFYGVDLYGDTTGGQSTSHSDCLYLTAPANNLSFVYNIVNSNFFGCLHGIYYGPNVQGVTVVNSNFTLNWNGIYLPPDSVGQSQLAVMNSQFDNTGDNILVDTGAASPQVFIKDNLFFTPPSKIGVNVLGTLGWFDFSGNQFNPTTANTAQLGTGIYVANGVGANLIRDNVCVHLDKCVELGPNVLTTKVSGTRVDSTSTKLAVINNSISATNFVTGFINPVLLAINYPQGTNIVGVADNGSGLIRLTLDTTANLTNGEIMFVNVPGMFFSPGMYLITVIDGTHIDLQASQFSGAYTGGGSVWVMP